MALFASQEIKRLTLPESDEWVEIRSAMTVGMRNRVFAASLKMRLTPAGGAENSEVDPLAYRTAICKEIIVAWSDPRPVTPEAIDGLDPAVHDWIGEQFDALVAGRDEATKNASGGSSSNGLSQVQPSNGLQASPASSPISSNSEASGTVA